MAIVVRRHRFRAGPLVVDVELLAVEKAAP
jgi:hypothetical protein